MNNTSQNQYQASTQRRLVDLLAGAAIGGGAALLSLKLLVLIAGTTFAVLLLIYPTLGFYAFISTIPVNIDFGGGITVTRGVTVLALCSLFLNAGMQRGPWIAVWRRPMGILGLFYFATVFIGITVHYFRQPDLDMALARLELGGYIYRAVLFFLVLTYVNSRRDLNKLLLVLIVVGLVEVVIALAQVQFRFVVPGEWRLAAEEMIDITDLGFRAEGTTAHPIFLAGYLQMVLALVVYEILVASKRNVRTFLLLMLPFILYAWFSAYSRSSMIAMVAMIMASFGLWSRFGRVLMTIGFLLMFVIFALHNWSVDAIIRSIESISLFEEIFRRGSLYESIGSFQFRIESWIGGWYLFLDNFQMGVGAGQAIHEYLNYLPAQASSEIHPSEIHNMFIEAAAEHGIVALGLLCTIWGYAFVSIIRSMKDDKLGLFAKTLFVILVGQFALLMFTPMIRDVWLTLPLAVVVGELARGSTDDEEESNMLPGNSAS